VVILTHGVSFCVQWRWSILEHERHVQHHGGHSLLQTKGTGRLALIEFSMMLPSYHAALILLMYQVYPLLFESLCSLPGIQWYSDAHLLQRGAYTSDVFFTGLEIFWPPEVCGIGCKWQKKPLRWCGAPCWLVMNRSSSNCPFVSLIWLSSFRLFAF
jgi:hypothetical protein